jgi:hypothetical protein
MHVGAEPNDDDGFAACVPEQRFAFRELAVRDAFGEIGTHELLRTTTHGPVS